MANDELRAIQEGRNAREEALDFLQCEWDSRFDPASFSRATLRRFYRKGLTIGRLLEAIEAVEWKAEKLPSLATNADDVWKYFCGVCWNMINGVVLVSDR